MLSEAEWAEKHVLLSDSIIVAPLHFTVARQRLTPCSRVARQRVCYCASVCSMGGRGAVGWGGVGWGAVGLCSDWSVVKNKPLAIITGNGLRHPLLCLVATHPPLNVYLSHCCHISCSFDLFFFPLSLPLEFSFPLYLLLYPSFSFLR